MGKRGIAWRYSEEQKQGCEDFTFHLNFLLATKRLLGEGIRGQCVTGLFHLEAASLRLVMTTSVFSTLGPLNLAIEVYFLGFFPFGFKGYHCRSRMEDIYISSDWLYIHFLGSDHILIMITEYSRG